MGPGPILALVAAVATASDPPGVAPARGQGTAPQSGWPAWRGPAGTGVSPETGWVAEGAAEPLWRREVGLGHSCPSIAGGRLYTLGFDPAAGLDVLWCLDAATGDELWTFARPASLDANGHGGGTLTTPAVAGDAVLVTSRRGVVRRLDARTGELAWEVDLMADHGVEPTDYGFGGSPLVLGERVVVNANRTFALDAESGEVLWRTREHLAMYSTPRAWETPAGTRVAVFTKEGLIVLDAGSGEELSHFPWRKGSTTVNASTPVVVDGTRLFVSSGYGHGGVLVEHAGDAPVAVWETRGLCTRLSGCVLVGDALYGFDDAVLKCFGLDGKERWRKRGLGQGALSAAGDRLLVLTGDGELLVARASPAGFEELARRPVVTGGACWTNPVLVGGLVYVRNGLGELVCLDHRRRDG